MTQAASQTVETPNQDMDTFDNPVEIPKETKKVEVKPTEKTGEKDAETKKKHDGQVDNLDEEEDKKDKQEKKPEDEKEKKDDAEKKEVPEVKKETKPAGKILKIKEGDEVRELSADSTVKVTVNGKGEFHTIQELINEFAGKKTVSEEIIQAKKEREQVVRESAKFKSERDVIVNHLTHIQKLMDDEKGDPLAPLLYLLDMSDRNIYDYTKRVFSHLSGEVNALSSMDEVEQQLYWTKKEADYLKGNHAAKVTRARQTQEQSDRVAKIDRLRESQGVSEEQYVQAHESLARLGFGTDKLTPENVVDYAVMQPFYDKSEKLCANFQDELDDSQMDDLIVVVAKTLKAAPRMKPEDVLEYSAKQLGWDVEKIADVIDDINNKASKNSQGKKESATTKNNDRPESFSDFDD